MLLYKGGNKELTYEWGQPHTLVGGDLLSGVNELIVYFTIFILYENHYNRESDGEVSI